MADVTGRTLMNPNWEREEKHKKVAKVLEEIAAEVGATNIQAGKSEFISVSLPALRGHVSLTLSILCDL